MARLSGLAIGLVALFSSGPAHGGTEPRFTLGFEGCPASPVEDAPGQVKRIEVFPTLTTSENNFSSGADGWSLSIEIIGANLKSITVEGVVVDAILNLDDDCDPTTPSIHYDHYPVDLADSFTTVASKASGEPPSPLNDPSRKGVISAVWVSPVYHKGCSKSPATLQPNGFDRIAKLIIEATIPDDGSEREVVLRYVDGLRSTVSQPVNNIIAFFGTSHHPDVKECRFTLRKGPGFPMGFGFSFEGNPEKILEGPSGDRMTFEIFPSLTTYSDLVSGGPESWTISIGITGGVIKAIDLKGITVFTIFDHDGDPGTPPLDPYPLELEKAWIWDAELATYGDDPSRKGAISMVTLSGSGAMALRPNTTQRIAKLIVEAVVPENGIQQVVLKFEDGFKSTGLPRKNWITIDDVYAPPSLGECRFTLVKGFPRAGVPGDSGQDGTLDISDAVLLLTVLFSGAGQQLLPCGNGLPTNSGNISLLDWQPDGVVDISDAIATLQFLFLGGPRHHLASIVNPTSGCAYIYGCDRDLPCR